MLPISPKASAALSRRILQHVLRENDYTGGDLVQEIEAAIPHLSSALGDSLHAVRVVGNFAAHPTKNTNTGEIVDVEPGEAEWLTELLVDVLDELYVKPAREKERRDELNARLRAAGRRELPPADGDRGQPR